MRVKCPSCGGWGYVDGKKTVHRKVRGKVRKVEIPTYAKCPEPRCQTKGWWAE